MASIVLTAVGNYLGGPIGAAIGSFIGSQIDQAIFGPTMKSEGPRLSDLSVQASTYGQPIPRIFGPENRLSGNMIWSTGLIETKSTTKQGGKGGGPKTETTSYTYHVDCAFALCRGPIAGVKRIWADGKLFRDAAGVQKHADALRIYLGTETQNPDPAIQATEGAANTPAHRGLAYVVFEGLQLGDFGNRIPNFTFEVEAHQSATVATVIEELCDAAGVPFLDGARADYLDLRGYTIARPSTVRQLLEPLRAAYFFDMSEIEGELQFFPVDSHPIARIPDDDLGAHPYGTDRPAPYEFKRSADAELPRQVVVQHMDPARDYQVNSQRARRSTLASDADVSIDVPVVLTGDEGKATAEKLLSMAWLRRNKVTTQLPVEYLHCEPGQKIVVAARDGKDRTLRIRRKETRLFGLVVVECETDGATVLSKTASAAPAPVPEQEIKLPGATVAHLMDLPILRDADDGWGFYLAASGASAGWRGAVLYRSLDAGVNYETFADILTGAIVGETGDALGEAPPHYWDHASSVTVTLLAPGDTLESVSEAAVLNGANACAIGDEVLQFRDAELVAPGTYVLTGLLRGRKGTEDKIAGHAPGERFVLLSGAIGIYRPEQAAAELGIERPYKAVSVGTQLVDAAVIDFANNGRWAKPYAVAHVAGSRNGGGDLSISWKRRTRFEAPWLDGADVPLGEESEAYEIDVLDGVDVVRTISAGLPSATYTAAEQTADFGAAQPAITVRIYQLSARVGRGLPKETTL